MTKLNNEVSVRQELNPEQNGNYLLPAEDMNNIKSYVMIPMTRVSEIIKTITDWAGTDKEIQMEAFTKLPSEEMAEVDGASIDPVIKLDEKGIPYDAGDCVFVSVYIGAVSYDLRVSIIKSKIVSIDAELNTMIMDKRGPAGIKVAEIPGMVLFHFLQQYIKYLLGEDVDIDFHAPSFREDLAID